MSRGFFISFEGIDGTGKSTQVKKLAEKLAGFNDVFVTKEPGDANFGSNIGNGIRQLLFHNPTAKNMHPGVSDLLFLADHVQTAGDIAKAVDEGKVVICDRYADSQFAYAASPTKQSPPWALDLYRQLYGIVPDMIVLLVVRGQLYGYDHLHSGPKEVLDNCDTCQNPPEPREDISWALGRAKGRTTEVGKQDGKPWNSVEEQRVIQNAYLNNLLGKPNSFIVDLNENNTVDEISTLIYNEVIRRKNRPMAQSTNV